MDKKYFAESVEEAEKSLNTSGEGLETQEAASRLETYGRNELQAAKKAGLLSRFIAQFKDVMVIVLLCAAVVTAVIAIIEKNWSDFIDVGIILAIVIINAIIGVAQESKAEQALEALKNMSKPYAKVKRNGEIVKVESATLVPGDLVILEAGDVVPADLRLVGSRSLKIEESALTGESVPSEKDAAFVCSPEAGVGDRINMAFSTSVVTYGRGEGIVTATGMNTEVGKLAGMLAESDETVTPIQKKLDKTGKVLSIAVVIIAVIIFIVTLISNAISARVTAESVTEAFMTAVAIAVAAIPEGLTAVITIIMAIGVQRMSKRNAIIKKLPAVETLGSTEIICSDKTGTLTLNKMTVKKIYADGEEAEDRLKKCMTLCNDTIIRKVNDEISLMGDPTETALVAYYSLTGDASQLIADNPRVDETPFDSVRKLMTTVNKTSDGKIVYTKGAPDMLIEKCDRILSGGEIRPITEEDRQTIAAKNSEFAHDALRVLAYAYKTDDGDEYEKNLVFLGLSGMIDPPREEVKDAVALCKRAGITAVMITGDHRDTAYAIARELGICSDESQVTTGAQLSEMTDDELAEHVGNYRVYARVSPEHKVRIVKAWKSRGKIVAMTGDGVNDAPGIKAADIGVGMGITGTDVTKGAADMVLADDNFATIVEAVKEGRKIFDNMQKTIQFLLSANICEVLSLFITTIVFAFIGAPADGVAFLMPIQILWVNLVTDSLPALALGMEEGRDDIMNNPPRKSDDNLFAGHLGFNILYQGAIQTIIVLAVFFGAQYGWKDHQVAEGMAFITLCLVQLFHCFNTKSLNGTIFHKDLFKNRFMLLSFFVGAALVVGVAVIPGVKTVFGVPDLSWQMWLTAIGASFSVIPLVELSKVGVRAYYKRKNAK